jgi:formate C-acetyltransferase
MTTLPDTIAIPLIGDAVSLELPPRLQALRERALAVQREPQPPIPELTLADARAWSAHTEDEHWLIWRARRCAERLASLPFDLEPGELVPGKPRFRHPSAEEQPALANAAQILSTMPPFPGGDTGHFHPDYDTLFRRGIGGLQHEIAAHLRRCKAGTCREALSLPKGAPPDEQAVFYEACRIVMQAFSGFIARCGEECAAMAEQDSEGADDWREIAAICAHIATEPPRTFREALQLMFLAEIALWFAEDHALASPGRMDQTLWRFYEADRDAGRVTPQRALELVSCLFIQMNRILWPGSAIAIMVGGRDREGRNVTNELTYLCLAARLATRLVYPTVGLAWHEGTPSELTDFAIEMLATGIADPAFFNDELIPLGLRDHGVSETDSFNYMNSTCVEIKVCGASNMWVTAPYFNCVQGVLDVLGDVTAGRVPAPQSFHELQEAVRGNLKAKIDQAAAHLDAVWQARAVHGGFPLASCVIADCLQRGQDFDRGGARYNWVENSFVGLANLVDSLIVIRELVYETSELSLDELWQALQADFAGHEPLRQRLLHRLPRYGNNLPEADALACAWADFLMDATEANTVGLHRYVPGFFCWVMHERMGSETGATPDGRPAGWPLADGAGGAQGRETCGPTAAVLSATCWSHRRVMGGLVYNAKFPRSLFRTAQDRQALRQIVETYLRRGGLEMQINVVGKETLLAAREHPEQYQDLLVRVAGYSDYFVHLCDKMQQEIIARSEHGL